MKSLAIALAATLVVTACSSADDATEVPRVTTAPTTEATAPASPSPAATSAPLDDRASGSLPPAEPIIRQRLVVTGPEEVVFDWTTDRCEDAHIPDITARAFRNADGEVNLTISHWNSYPMVGATLDAVATDCNRLQLSSDYEPDPAAFNDSEWIGSVFTDDGRTVYAVVHNEYRGDTHVDAFPAQCPSGQRLPCLDTSFTMAVSTDGGRTFDHIAEPPNHLIASLPYTYRDDTVPSGIRQPSNIIQGPDGDYYLFGNVSDQPDEQQWVCAMRTPDLGDPAAWRYWTGDDFTGEWKNPYTEDVSDDDKCAPLALGALSGSVQESVVFDETLGRYVMVGMAFDAFALEPNWGVYTSTSEDLIEWTPREFLVSVPIGPSAPDPDNGLVYAYPAIIDPDSASLSFTTTDGEMYLYLSRFNFGGNSLDRDLVRWPIAVETVEVDVPEWNFDDASDLDETAGGWSARFHMDPLTVADGALEFRTTDEDPHLQTGSIVLPADYDRVTIRMQLPDGVTTSGELFWVTNDDLELDGVKYEQFELVGTGDFVDVVIDLADNPAWTGTIRSLRLDPVFGEPIEGAIDRIWFERTGR